MSSLPLPENIVTDVSGDGCEREARLETPFDIGLVPDAFYTHDAPPQADALANALRARDLNDDNGAGFFHETRKNISLSVLEKWYREGHKMLAVSNLENRKRIVYNANHIEDVNSNELLWTMGGNFLDLIVCVGRGIGLGPAMRNVEADHGAEFKLDLSNLGKRFTAKNVKLGFEPTGRMMWIGTSPSGEDVWLAFVTPESQIMEDGESLVVRRPHQQGSTTLNVQQQRRVFMFLAKVLGEMMYRYTVVHDDYPDVEDAEAFELATNIRTRRDKIMALNVRELENFDRIMRATYVNWVERSPDSYKEDKLLVECIPICITSRYGQNQQFGISSDDEPGNWRRDRKWDRVRYLNVAIASHLRVRKVRRWENVDLDLIFDDYPTGVFDGFDPTERQQLNREELEALPYADDNGHPIQIFDKYGYPIDRRLGVYVDGAPSLGILVKSERLRNLFAPEITDVLDHEERNAESINATTEFTFYPQAGLQTVGHFQAGGIATKCHSLVTSIDKHVRSLPPRDNDDDYEYDEDEIAADLDPHRRAIYAISSQGYNAVTHRTRGRRAQHHDAQIGLVTSALGGAWASGGSSQATTASKQLAACTHRMPHKSFADKIRNDSKLERDLRLENVYYIDMDALPEKARDGEVILNEILVPLAEIWNHGSLFFDLRKHVELFKPEVFPSVYKWTTYPLTCLLENIFAQAVPLYGKDKFKHALMVEICSVVERALNFMHTGNMAVIATTVMNPLWIGRAIVKDGFPCFDPKIMNIVGGTVDVVAHRWPLNELFHRPHSSSRRSHIFTYGESHFSNFFAHLSMAVILARPVESEHLMDTNERTQIMKAIANHAIQVFIQDCKDFVEKLVLNEIKHQVQGPPADVAHAEERKKALSRWLASPNALVWKRNCGPESTYSYGDLVIALSESSDDLERGVTRANESWSYERLAQHMIDSVEASTTSFPAPITKKGFFPSTLRIALEEIRRVSAGDATKSTPAFRRALLVYVMSHLRIGYVPWHRPAIETQRGPPPRTITHQHWMFIDTGKKNNNLKITEKESRPEKRAQVIAEKAAQSHPSAPWTVPTYLKDMGNLWNKESLPDQWNIQNASLDAIGSRGDPDVVVATYHWFKDNYDGGNWKHHMTLVWAILFTAILPNVSCTSSEKAEIPKQKSESEMTRAIRSLRWVPSTETHKGVTARAPYITMVSTAILAILLSDSPLREFFKEKGKFGESWTEKHGAKYIHQLLYIRLGLGVVTKKTIIGRAKLNSNWALNSDIELERLYNKVLENLKDREFGVYYAIQEIFGVEMANYAAENGHTQRP